MVKHLRLWYYQVKINKYFYNTKAIWCKGSTTDFDSVSFGSNPSVASKNKIMNEDWRSTINR